MMAAPKIRFKGFAGDWEQRKLGEVVSVFDGTHQTPNYIKSGIMFLSVENINTLQSEKFISEEDFDKEFKIFPEYGDILMTRIGDIGTANVVRSNNKIAYYVSLALMKSQQVDSDFLVAAISSENMQLEIWKRTLHVAFPKKINKNEIDKLNIVIPQKAEQEKIGNLFCTLDHSIALHKRKLDGLKELKKGYLQQMFPLVGERVPRVRFAGFSGDWEIRKMGEISIKSGQKNKVNKNLPAYSISNQVGFVPQNEHFEESRLDNLDKSAYKIVQPDEFAYNPARVNVGSIAFNNLAFPVIISSLYVVVKMSKLIDNNYILQYILSPRFNEEVKKNTEGTVREYLFYENFSNIQLPYPTNITEQTAIGNFFRGLDEQIATQQTKLDKLKQLKVAYLQSMFV